MCLVTCTGTEDGMCFRCIMITNILTSPSPPSSHRTPDQFLQSSNHQNHPTLITTMQHKQTQVYATHLKIFCQSWDPHIHPLIRTPVHYYQPDATTGPDGTDDDTMEQTLVCVGNDRDMSVENPAYHGTNHDMLRNGSWHAGSGAYMSRNGS